MKNNITIIIPTYNEAESIGRLVLFLKNYGGEWLNEIIVCDGGSIDETTGIAGAAGAVAHVSPKNGRAAQMNYGASLATGDILYFVHADTFPPESFAADIIQAVEKGFDCGRYRTEFNSKKWLLKINAWFTRFDWFICNGGDQTFFITKKLFDELQGYNSDMLIMEEYDLTERAKKKGRYKIFRNTALVSARKYAGRSWWQVLMANKMAVSMYKEGASQEAIAIQYKKMLGNQIS